MLNYCEENVREVNYFGYSTQRCDVLDNYAEEIKHHALVNRTSRPIKTKHKDRFSTKLNGKVKVFNMYDRIMTAEEFNQLTDEQKLITIEEYKTRHGLINACISMGKPENWLNNQRSRAIARLAKKGIDSKRLIAEHILKMKFDKANAPKKERHNRKLENRVARLEAVVSEMQERMGMIEDTIANGSTPVSKRDMN